MISAFGFSSSSDRNEADDNKLRCFICSGLGEEMQWCEPRPRHIRDPKTRLQEDTLQVTHLGSVH